MSYNEFKFRRRLRRMKFIHWQLRLKQSDIDTKASPEFKHKNKLRGIVRNKLLYYFNYSATAKVYEKVSKDKTIVTDEQLKCSFFFNIKKIRTLPYFFNKKKLYVIYQLPFLKQVLRGINMTKISYFYKYVRTIFLKDYISYKSLFFKLKVSLIFLIYIYIVKCSAGDLSTNVKGGSVNAGYLPMDALIKRFYFVWVLSAGQGGKC